MNKIKIVDLIASVCLLIGFVINIVELCTEIPFALSLASNVLIAVGVILWLWCFSHTERKK